MGDNLIFKVIVAGGREFNDYELVRQTLDYYLSQRLPNVQIVSGKATGADTLGERYAAERKLSVAEFPADWKGHKKAAGPIRNKQMSEYADACICFWDGKSKGTKHMIDLATKKGLPLKVVRY